eukprot:TRINITY_DN4839_c1_g1_i1.p4 TRINITY_DN4839_c1_g1~~TRINITY_DN4839_c1_g1_i1.p4  ORF type:complete len:119 (-),score=0.83 TRINITY_DN4839_c1_g1_i1:1146-1502(-)
MHQFSDLVEIKKVMLLRKDFMLGKYKQNEISPMKICSVVTTKNEVVTTVKFCVCIPYLVCFDSKALNNQSQLRQPASRIQSLKLSNEFYMHAYRHNLFMQAFLLLLSIKRVLSFFLNH